MIPPLSPALRSVQPLFERRFPTPFKAHILAIGILASTALLVAAPWEFAIPVGACILFASLLFSLPSCPAISVEPAPLYVQNVQPLRTRASPIHIPSRILPPPRDTAPPGPRIPIRIAPPQSDRAPVGTGGRTPTVPPSSAGSAGRAPVGGGARTPPQPPLTATQNPVRAPVGGR